MPDGSGRGDCEIGMSEESAIRIPGVENTSRAAESMRIIWHIDEGDVCKVKRFLADYASDAFVANRRNRNLSVKKSPITIEDFWQTSIECLLTTQQRSGPDSAIARFIRTRPFRLGYAACVQVRRLDEFVTLTLSSFGGIRRTTRIGREAKANFEFLSAGGWQSTFDVLEDVRSRSTRESERHAARYIADHFQGFGPKQSRNLLQCLGLSRYEIPIDSRTTKWLEQLGFPMKLKAQSLADEGYYQLICDGFQHLAEACGEFPCVLDASIFASFDRGKWNSENVIA